MTAGASARFEAQRSLLEAGEYERLADEARAQARRYALASQTEASVGVRLEALESLGWRVLADRRWAGSKRANVDFLLVGPGGVAIVDVKAWRGLQVVDDSIFCDDDCRDDEAGKLLSLTQRVRDCVSALGLTHQALWPVLVFAGREVDSHAQGVHLVGERNVASWLTRRGLRLTTEQIEDLASLLDEQFPTYEVVEKPTAVRPLRRQVAVPRVPPSSDPDVLFDVEELTESIIEAALQGPIESWMTFLHPDQLRLVSTSWSGPARVRGPAGTGKTVVGLHRAAHLAQRSANPILFVAFVRTLPNVLRGLAARLSPGIEQHIEFTGLHALAKRLLDESGTSVRLDGKRVDAVFEQTWASLGRSSILADLDGRWTYWKEELDYVIKGRGLTDWREYAELTRVGRRTAMRREHRAVMWDLYVEYERRLKQAGVHDFNDVLIMARDAVSDGNAEASYGAVIVDEVQDLTMVGLQLLHAIAGDGPNGLLLIGDGQQSVYPGGFTLVEAGVSVTGRATVLKSNYRNTAEILDVATRLVSADSYDDLEVTSVSGMRPTEVLRHGFPPLIVRARDPRSLEVALVRQIQDTVARLRVPLGDMAVLVHRLKDLEHYRRVLLAAGVPTVELTEYDGITIDKVKLGTFKRAKGLEFTYVLLPGLVENAARRWTGESDDAYRERAERFRRELFVGMTRARDGLWLGYLS